MYDYRNNLKIILSKTSGDDKSLQNSLTAIKAIIGMSNDDTNVPTSKSSNNQKNDELVRTMLQGVARLLEHPGDEDAKQASSSALHKLTFVPGVSKKYGKALGRLDRAIQASTETKAAAENRIFEEAMKKPIRQIKRDYRTGKRYTVIRTLTGAELTTDNGDVAFEVKESQIHSLNLKTGDIVEAIEDKTSSPYEAEVLRIVGFRNLRKRDYDPIDDFKYGVVQGSQGNLSVSRNIKGERLKIRGKTVIVPVDSSYYQDGNVHLEDGSIVDLAWYSEDVRLKRDPASAVHVRWIYETQQPKRISKGNKKKDTKEKNPNQQLDKLDLNLHYQRVGIAIGNNQNEAILEGIVNRYNGIPIAINAFEGKKKVIENQLKDLDIVILVTAFAAHDSTWNIREFASKYGIKFAVSSSKGYQAFERALYRAANGLPAYEGTQSIEYKTLK
ncbi:hypothetical protein J2Z60_000074 [Lactobacillus colini]|uniref:V-type sodium ATP synthase subunit n=1 Tax=Lactobacillus colini TaxID=1819254 RepID=A0ABS4MBY5_9LACO|nr:DUF2325 domain-containing protein [Lactobacillus colini]MBP2056912.1 hypothetical protein [Lactobacillus colini]